MLQREIEEEASKRYLTVDLQGKHFLDDGKEIEVLYGRDGDELVYYYTDDPEDILMDLVINGPSLINEVLKYREEEED